MRAEELDAALEGILFAAGESVPVTRIAKVLEVSADSVYSSAERLAKYYVDQLRGIRLSRMGGSLQLTSAPELAEVITDVLETRKPPKLSQAALEVLAIVAYFQPVTRAYIDRTRGVDSAYTIGVLAERELIIPAGRLDVPGRPILYQTGEVFLRTMGITSTDELPKLPDIATNEGLSDLKARIDAMQDVQLQLMSESSGDVM